MCSPKMPAAPAAVAAPPDPPIDTATLLAPARIRRDRGLASKDVLSSLRIPLTVTPPSDKVTK